MKNTLLNKIENHIKPKTVDVKFEDTDIVIEVTDYVSTGELSAAVETISDMVRLNDYTYELIDILMGYYVISLFTNIPIPTTGDGDEEMEDYQKCYDICMRLNLIDALCETSDNITESIAFIEKNVWRRLEYTKAMKANESLMLLCDKAYEMLENLDGLLGGVDIDMLNQIADQLGDTASKLSLVENKTE